MAWAWLRRRRVPSWQEQPVVEECEAFLAGRYVEYAQEKSGPVPGWAWLNRLAHRSEEELISLAADPSLAAKPREPTLTAELAAEILALARQSDVPVAVIQASTLVPLELQMADSQFSWTRGSSFVLEKLVCQALERDFPTWSHVCQQLRSDRHGPLQ